ncbi:MULTISPECIES: PRC-barrel domain-containing protein [Methylobacterium]|uniref:PRC-barrel domain-containing protein n=1 Tax=Methylobacterium TaxID=407 RepID=UPI0013EBE3E6|nr:PRC-barrel domain-containing protein [Methylobacterium sp. DB0501]NGM34568.1 PRC-barrel domain containing protein [Methylobacterium sp. DB0501]
MTLKTALATTALVLATGSILSLPALAQTATQQTATGATTQPAKTATVQFVTVQPNAAVTSRILGTKVTNTQNESIGDIADLVIVDGKTVQAVILGVGGFLGIGERYVAVSPDSVVLTRDGDGWKATVNATKDDLNKAPAFDYKRKS